MPEIKILPGLATAVKDFFNHDEALGLPKGSIRGIVFVIFAATASVLAIKQLPIPSEVSNILSAISGFYFGQKITNGNGHPPAAP